MREFNLFIALIVYNHGNNWDTVAKFKNLNQNNYVLK